MRSTHYLPSLAGHSEFKTVGNMREASLLSEGTAKTSPSAVLLAVSKCCRPPVTLIISLASMQGRAFCP